MKLLVFLSLATLACASVYEVPIAKAVIVQHVDSDIIHYEDDVPEKRYVVVPAKQKVYVPIQNVIHPALSTYLYAGKKYTVHYPSGLYHGPHGVGIYDPKFHDELEEAYYRG